MNLSYLDKYEKENNCTKEPDPPKTRQYSKTTLTPSELKNTNDHARANKNYFNHSNMLSPVQNVTETNKYDNFDYQKYQRPNTLSQYSKSKGNQRKNIQPYDKYLNYQQVPRKEYNPKQNNNQFEYSFVSNKANDPLLSQIGKRENARTKGLEMKMNNIEYISDQIGNLLNMVNNTQSKTPNKSSKSPSPMNKPTNKDYSYKYDKMQRLKTVSGYERGEEYNVSPKNGKAKYMNLNEEEINYGKISMQSHPLAKYAKNDPDIAYLKGRSKDKLQPITQNGDYSESKLGKQLYSIPNKYKQDLSPNKYRENLEIGRNTRFTPRPETEESYAISPKASPHIQEISSFDRKWNNEQAQQSSGSNDFQGIPRFKNMFRREQSDNNFLPVSLQNLRNYGQQKYAEPSLIDQKLRKIQQKIKKSQQGKINLQKRLEETILEQDLQQSKPAGKLYKKHLDNQQNKFQIKVYPVKVERENVVKMAMMLREQIELDNLLKNPREEFIKDTSQDKWQRLEVEINSKGVKLSQTVIKELISIPPQQFSLHQEYIESSEEQLADLVAKAQQHWQRDVCGCVDARALNQQCFDASQLDQQRKGYISQEDLASFISRYTGHSLVNRDVSIIYRRLKLQESRRVEGLQFSTFLRVLAL